MIRPPPRPPLFPSPTLSRSPGAWSTCHRRHLCPALGAPTESRPAPPDESARRSRASPTRSEEHTSELQSQSNLVCRLLLEKKKTTNLPNTLSANHNHLDAFS